MRIRVTIHHDVTVPVSACLTYENNGTDFQYKFRCMNLLLPTKLVKKKYVEK